MFDAADRRFMKKALALAEKALGLASPNPSVGCLVVRDGQIVGRGWHEYADLDHAEIRALREASELSRSATAYVTLEPCCHQGRTPPCVDRLIQSGISRVVVARSDPNPRVAGRGIELLRASGIRVDVGLMDEAAGEVIEAFACHVTTGLPLVVSKVGMSLDGRIGTGTKGRCRITSPESGNFGQRLRLSSDALLVGVDTVLEDDPELTYRAKRPKIRHLIRVVLDSRLRTPPASRLFQARPGGPILIFCSDEASVIRQKELEGEGAEVVRVSGSGGVLDLGPVLEELGKRGVLGLLVEGGSRVHWSFVSKNLVDKFFFIVAPLILGGVNSIPSVGGEGYGAVEDALRFRIRKTFTAGPDLIFETYPSCSRSIISPWIHPESAASAARGSLPASVRR